MFNLIYEIGFNNYIYHWGYADKTFINQAIKRHPEFTHFALQMKMINFHTIVRDTPILVKEAFNFSLKTYARTLAKYNLISKDWLYDNNVDNGLTAMLTAYIIINLL
jgi:hypothetical protein